MKNLLENIIKETYGEFEIILHLKVNPLFEKNNKKIYSEIFSENSYNDDLVSPIICKYNEKNIVYKNELYSDVIDKMTIYINEQIANTKNILLDNNNTIPLENINKNCSIISVDKFYFDYTDNKAKSLFLDSFFNLYIYKIKDEYIIYTDFILNFDNINKIDYCYYLRTSSINKMYLRKNFYSLFDNNYKNNSYYGSDKNLNNIKFLSYDKNIIKELDDEEDKIIFKEYLLYSFYGSIDSKFKYYEFILYYMMNKDINKTIKKINDINKFIENINNFINTLDVKNKIFYICFINKIIIETKNIKLYKIIKEEYNEYFQFFNNKEYFEKYGFPERHKEVIESANKFFC